LLPLVTGGCTGLLLDSTDLSNKPDADPHLRLFEARRQKDLVVVYDEYSERTKSTRARAYLLYKNQARIAQSQSPHFTSLRTVRGLPLVPVFPDPLPVETNSRPPLYAVVTTNTESFMVYSNNQVVGSHDLPIYTDRASEVERVIFSPVAITVDVALVAGAIYLWLIADKTENWPAH